jgi:DHA1 family bicyclomycin/chloramphenicol resistance-like MFS transporter
VKHEIKLTGFHRIVLGVLSAFGPLAMDLYLPGLPHIQREMHTSASMAQLTMTATLLGLAVGQAVLGPLSDRIGRKKIITATVLLFAITSALITQTMDIHVMIFYRFFQGIAGSAGIVLSLAMITDVFAGRELTKNVTINQTINGIFPVLAPMLGGVVMIYADWQMNFWILAGLGVVLFFSSFLLPETRTMDARQANKANAVKAYLHLFKQREFMLYMVVQTATMAALFSYIAGSAFVLERIFGLSTAQFGIVYAINGAGIALMTMVSGRLAAKYGEQNSLGVFVGMASLGAVGLVLTLLLPKNLWLFLPPLFLVVASIGGNGGMTTSLAMAKQRANPGAASALLGVMRYAVGGVISPVVGIFGATSYAPMALLILGLELVAVMAYLLSRRLTRVNS